MRPRDDRATRVEHADLVARLDVPGERVMGRHEYLRTPAVQLGPPRDVGVAELARRLEVKSGRAGASQPGIAAFSAAFAGLGPVRPLLVGGDGIALERFLLEPADRWLRGSGGEQERHHVIRPGQ
jgi:hypothetical protein